MHPSWYGTLGLGTGAAARYRMHLCILAGMVHCVGTGATVQYRMHLCILAGMVHCVLVQVLRCDIGCICAS